jgi:hypothetical protein
VGGAVVTVTHQCSVQAVVHDASHSDNDGDHGKSYERPVHDCQLSVVRGDISHTRHEPNADDGHYLVTRIDQIDNVVTKCCSSWIDTVH